MCGGNSPVPGAGSSSEWIPFLKRKSLSLCLLSPRHRVMILPIQIDFLSLLWSNNSIHLFIFSTIKWWALLVFDLTWIFCGKITPCHGWDFREGNSSHQLASCSQLPFRLTYNHHAQRGAEDEWLLSNPARDLPAARKPGDELGENPPCLWETTDEDRSVVINKVFTAQWILTVDGCFWHSSQKMTENPLMQSPMAVC